MIDFKEKKLKIRVFVQVPATHFSGQNFKSDKS